MTTGQRIKAARKAANMTQSALANKLKIPYQSIGQWERDIRNPKNETLQRIAEALGTTVTELRGPYAIASERLSEYTSCHLKALEQLEQVKASGAPQSEIERALQRCESLARLVDDLSLACEEAKEYEDRIDRGEVSSHSASGDSSNSLTNLFSGYLSIDAIIPPREKHPELYEYENEFVYKALLRIDEAFTKLNDEGIEEAVKRVQELTEIPKYQRAEDPDDK